LVHVFVLFCFIESPPKSSSAHMKGMTKIDGKTSTAPSMNKKSATTIDDDTAENYWMTSNMSATMSGGNIDDDIDNVDDNIDDNDHMNVFDEQIMTLMNMPPPPLKTVSTASTTAVASSFSFAPPAAASLAQDCMFVCLCEI
jgi:hypothetical protein